MINPARLEQLMTRIWELLSELHAFEREYNALGGAEGLTDELFVGKSYTRADFEAAVQIAAGCTGLIIVKANQATEDQAAAAGRAGVLCKVKQ